VSFLKLLKACNLIFGPLAIAQPVIDPRKREMRLWVLRIQL
jgi:hypothetical protein